MPFDFRVNSSIDTRSASREFADHAIVQIRDVFEAATAERLHRCLASEIPWALAYEEHGVGKSVSSRELADPASRALLAADQSIFSSAQRGFAYRYLNYPILDAYLQKWPNEVALLHDLLEFLNGPSWLPLIRSITGMGNLRKCDAQASLYAANCFLHRHSDAKEQEGWRVAYVLNFTRNWRPDFGGVLNFLDDAGNTTIGLLPAFNTLNRFRVPRWHMVSYVPPYAPPERLAITGWFRDR